MTVRLGTASPYDILLGGNSVRALYLGATAVWTGRALPPGPPHLFAIGDSTVAEYPTGQGITPIASLVNGVVPTTLAVPGQTIDQQLAVWNAAAGKNTFAVGVIQVGLNNIRGTGDASATIARLQNLVNVVRDGMRVGSPLIISQMVPARGRWYDVFGADGGPVGQQQWIDINAAIAGTGPTPITGVDARVTSHVAQLADQAGNLLPQYQALGDGIHENNAARTIIAAAWRAAIVATHVLSAG